MSIIFIEHVKIYLEYLREAADRASFVDVHVEKSILNLK